MDALSASPPPFPATLQTFHRLVGHWKNPKIAKCFSLWNWDCKMYFKRAVRNGRCVCKKDGNFRFNSRVNPEVVMLCDCEFCSSSSHPTAVAVFPYTNKDLLLIDGAEEDLLVRGPHGSKITTSLSGKWCYKYYWQALGLPG
eukprot:CAMPEP_0172192514 /NCGR_PEP_ID=MMETSP1050-20130122/24366_1 /TAXON_ID=233186 /ORGANISM="Cryptomonas curvata, Strain CCAP979/52" /LENGTH=141 /DNA_ID=CAMNT_0012867817 /DNA_START=136 /DNA_END=557 /DNA_ORIENTATION=+